MEVKGDLAGILKTAMATDGWPSEDLLPLVYDELRSLAETRMRGEAQGQTLQATALVHEAWLKLAAGGDRTWADRTHFLRAAAQAMRRILVDRARAKLSIKRGERSETLDIRGIDLMDAPTDDRVLLIDDMLKRLEVEDPDSARVVTLKFFGGLTNKEIADVTDVAARTAARQWAYAKACLYRMIKEEMP
jgi:RNA polymerase sigma factor (TIGR02999 family)